MPNAEKKIEVVNQVTEYNEFEAKLANFKSQYEGVVYDLTDPDKEKEAKADRLSIGKVIASLDREHDRIKAPYKEKIDLIDSERKRIKDGLLAVQGGIKGQIKAHEQKIADHAEMLGNKVQAIYDLGEFGEFEKPDSENLKARIASLKSIEIDDSYEFRKADATLAEVDTAKKLAGMLAEAMKREAEQKELELLRKAEEDRKQAEHEEKIRAEAAEQAKREAEAAAQQKIDNANREKIEAEQAAKREADEAEELRRQAAIDAELEKQRAIEDERKRIQEEQEKAKAEAEAKQKEEGAKKAKQAHRVKIHKEAKESFMALGFTDEVATDIVKVIKDGLIKHIKVEY